MGLIGKVWWTFPHSVTLMEVKRNTSLRRGEERENAIAQLSPPQFLHIALKSFSQDFKHLTSRGK